MDCGVTGGRGLLNGILLAPTYLGRQLLLARLRPPRQACWEKRRKALNDRPSLRPCVGTAATILSSEPTPPPPPSEGARSPPDSSPPLGWCLPVYTRMSPRAEAGRGCTNSPPAHSQPRCWQNRAAGLGTRGRAALGRGAAPGRANAPGPLHLAHKFPWQLGSVDGGRGTGAVGQKDRGRCCLETHGNGLERQQPQAWPHV